MCAYLPFPRYLIQSALDGLHGELSGKDLLLMFFFSSSPLFFSFGAEEPFSFYSDQTSYLSICLEEHNRFQVEHFSQEELKEKVLTY